tara:strand:+ start:171 stop:557 length:387 start_codon:yes stop_codon:yes gene_type:complete
MIVTALIFLGTFVILPAGLSFAVEGDGRSKKPKPKPVEIVPEPEPTPLPPPEPEVSVDPEPAPEPELVSKTVVTISPKCNDEESIARLRSATFSFLSKVSDLPPDISFDIVDCTQEGMVDIEIVQVPK